MGRGQVRSNPRNLLFGPRRRGSGPNGNLGASLDLPGWSKFCSSICAIVTEQGLALPRQHHSFADQEDNVKREMIVIDWEDSHLRLTPYFDKQIRGVGIYYYSTPFELNIESHLLPGGSREVASLDEAEEILVPALQDRSLATIELILDGQEILARLDAGEELDLVENSWSESTTDESRLDACLEIIETAREGNYINGEETSVLRQLIFDCKEGDYFDQLHHHPFGAVAIGSQTELAVRRSI